MLTTVCDPVIKSRSTVAFDLYYFAVQPSIKAAAEERSSRAAGAARVAAEVMFD